MGARFHFNTTTGSMNQEMYEVSRAPSVLVIMEYESFEISEARIKFGNSSWRGFKQMEYPITDQQKQDLIKRFTYHAPKNDQPARYVLLRDNARELALMITTNTPPSREQSLALTHLEEAIFWANAAIARNE